MKISLLPPPCSIRRVNVAALVKGVKKKNEEGFYEAELSVEEEKKLGLEMEKELESRVKRATWVEEGDKSQTREGEKEKARRKKGRRKKGNLLTQVGEC